VEWIIKAAVEIIGKYFYLPLGTVVVVQVLPGRY
jgi:hypothetical protein